jgi:hypothetical protein
MAGSKKAPTLRGMAREVLDNYAEKVIKGLANVRLIREEEE